MSDVQDTSRSDNPDKPVGLYKPPQNHPVKLPDLAPRPAWLRSPYPHLSFKALGDKHPSVVRDTWLSQVPTSSQPVAPTGKDLAGGRMKASSTAVVAPSSSSSRPQPHRGGFQAGTGRTSEDTMLQQDIIPPVPVKLADDQVPAFAENMVPSVEELVVTLCSITATTVGSTERANIAGQLAAAGTALHTASGLLHPADSPAGVQTQLEELKKMHKEVKALVEKMGSMIDNLDGTLYPGDE